MDGHVAHMSDVSSVQRILVTKHGGKRVLDRHRRRREDNIGMDFKTNDYGLDSSGSG